MLSDRLTAQPYYPSDKKPFFSPSLVSLSILCCSQRACPLAPSRSNSSSNMHQGEGCRFRGDVLHETLSIVFSLNVYIRLLNQPHSFAVLVSSHVSSISDWTKSYHSLRWNIRCLSEKSRSTKSAVYFFLRKNTECNFFQDYAERKI